MHLNRTTWSRRFLSHKLIDWGPFIKLYFCCPTTTSHLWSSIVCCCSVAHSCLTLCDPTDCSMPDFLFLHYLPEFAQTHVHWLSDGWMNHFILYRPLPLLPSIFPNINVFSNELALQIRRRKCWNFGFNISPSNEYSELISFRSDWFDLLAVQAALMCLLQHHSSKASVLQCSAFFMVQI